MAVKAASNELTVSGALEAAAEAEAAGVSEAIACVGVGAGVVTGLGVADDEQPITMADMAIRGIAAFGVLKTSLLRGVRVSYVVCNCLRAALRTLSGNQAGTSESGCGR